MVPAAGAVRIEGILGDGIYCWVWRWGREVIAGAWLGSLAGAAPGKDADLAEKKGGVAEGQADTRRPAEFRGRISQQKI